MSGVDAFTVTEKGHLGGPTRFRVPAAELVCAAARPPLPSRPD
jgi:hypothetical protein